MAVRRSSPVVDCARPRKERTRGTWRGPALKAGLNRWSRRERWLSLRPVYHTGSARSTAILITRQPGFIGNLCEITVRRFLHHLRVQPYRTVVVRESSYHSWISPYS